MNCLVINILRFVLRLSGKCESLGITQYMDQIVICVTLMQFSATSYLCYGSKAQAALRWLILDKSILTDGCFRANTKTMIYKQYLNKYSCSKKTNKLGLLYCDSQIQADVCARQWSYLQVILRSRVDKNGTQWL